MRLGGPVGSTVDAGAWATAHVAAGYIACVWPNPPEAEEEGYCRAAQTAGLVISEVGAWCNPMSSDPVEREKALAWCQHQLAVADRVGARCCVNIAGSLGAKWDGPCAEDLSERAFAQIVSTTQAIIDAVQPTRSYYTLETMPWMYPDSIESYLELIAAIDRERFAVHFDPVNLLNCPERFFHNGEYMRNAITALGSKIRSCHAKDIRMDDKFTVHLDEVAPGDGTLDFAALLHALDTLDPDTPLILEHLPMEHYPRAAQYIREIAEIEGIRLDGRVG